VSTKIHYQARGILALLIILTFSLGCDKLEELRSKYLKKDKPQPVAVVKPQEVPPQPEKLDANTLARVGSWTISKEEFNDRLAALKEVVPEYDITDPESKRLVLEELIRQQLLVLDAEKRGVAASKDITAAVDEFRRTLIVREGATDLTKGISVTEEEAKQFYDEQKDLLKQPEQWRVREIVVKTQIEANELLVEILKGSDFAQQATLHSISESASKGGDLGFLEQEPFAEMANELVKLKKGEVSGVFKGPDGYYIVKLEDVKGGEQIPYDEIKQDIIQNRTIIKQQQVILDYIKKLEGEIKVEINEGLLN